MLPNSLPTLGVPNPYCRLKSTNSGSDKRKGVFPDCWPGSHLKQRGNITSHLPCLPLPLLNPQGKNGKKKRLGESMLFIICWHFSWKIPKCSDKLSWTTWSFKIKMQVHSLWAFLLCSPPNLTLLKGIITTLVTRKDVSREKYTEEVKEGIKGSCCHLPALDSSQFKGITQCRGSPRPLLPQWLGCKQAPGSYQRSLKWAMSFLPLSVMLR